MAKKNIKITANVVDTHRPTVAGAKEHPGWNALRSIARLIDDNRRLDACQLPGAASKRFADGDPASSPLLRAGASVDSHER